MRDLEIAQRGCGVSLKAFSTEEDVALGNPT